MDVPDASAPTIAPSIAPSIGIEVAESGTRLTATVCGPTIDSSARRWHGRLDTPPTPGELTTAIIALADRVLREGISLSLADQPRPPLGIAIWADVDADRGRVRGLRHAPGWDAQPGGYPLADALSARWGVPTALRTAPQAAALAEARQGAGQGARLVLYILQGRSVWNVLVADGEVVTGAGTPDGQLAHWRVATSGPRCACGAVGHLDPLASAQSLVRNMIGRAAASDESTAAMLAASGGRAEAMSAAQVVHLAARGEPAAREVVEVALDALASALANLSIALSPDRIVWGGPLATSTEWLAELRPRLATLLPAGMAAPSVLPGSLEPIAALLGACLIAPR